MSTNMTKAERRDAARAEALALQKKQQSAEKRSRLIVLSALGLGLVALIVAVVLIFAEGQTPPMERVDGAPAGVVDDTGISVGADGVAGTSNEGAERLDTYVDYMCPYCGQFEAQNGADITELREAGDVTLVIHPVSILDRLSEETEYSTRAASAAAWVADRAPEQFLAFHEALFANQPDENTPGLSNEQLAGLADEAGVPAEASTGIADGEAVETFEEWVRAATEAAGSDESLQAADGTFSTPTVLVGGERFDAWTAPGALTGALTGEAPASE
jgi:protein-disulfide isomerase